MEKELFIRERKRVRTGNMIRYPIIFGIAYILGMTTLFDKISPFPAAFIGSLSGGDCGAAFLGSVLGFIAKGQLMEAVPSVVALAVIGIMRMFFGRTDSKGIQVGSALLSGASVLLTGAVSALSPTDFLLALVFGIVSGGSCYALFLLYRLSFNERSAVMKPSNAAAIGIVVAFSVASLVSLEIGIFNIGVILSGALISMVSGRFRFSGGAVFGVICTFGMALGGADFLQAGLILSLGGIVSGVFYNKGTAVRIGAFMLSSALSACFLGINQTTLRFLADALASQALYAMLPSEKIMRCFQPSVSKKAAGDSRRVFSGRLMLMSDTMDELCRSIDKTASTLDKNANRDAGWIYNSACDKVCRSCRHNMQCWGEEYNDSIRQMNLMLKELRNGGTVSPGSFGGRIGIRCQRKKELALELNDRYRDFVISRQNNRKIREMREILISQLSSSGNMLKELAGEIGADADYDLTASSKLERLLERCGLTEPCALARVENGNLSVEAYGGGKIQVEPKELADLAAKTLHREFDLPDIRTRGDMVRVTMFQRATYAVKTGVSQYSKGNGEVCGDYVDSFIDGRGHAYIVLSDGMGSGSRAKIDSSFAGEFMVRLLESGVSPETAVEMLNTSLLVKSADESFSTLDICRIDLYTGKGELYKAGGTASYVKSGKSFIKIDGGGLPVGISFTVTLESTGFNIGDGDMVVLTSDGADLNEQWFTQAAQKDSSRDIEAFARTIAAAAKFGGEKGREDDITVAVIKLVK